MSSPTAGQFLIRPCWVKDVYDVIVLFNVAHKAGTFSDYRLSANDKEKVLGSGFWTILRTGTVDRWTDGIIFSQSRMFGPFLIYRQVDERQPRGNSRKTPYPSNATRGSQRNRILSGNKSESTVYSSAVVGSWKDNAAFTKNGMCKKTITISFGEAKYRVFSYYNTDDAEFGKLPRASEVPEYRDMEIDPEILEKAMHIRKDKRGIQLQLLKNMVEQSVWDISDNDDHVALSDSRSDTASPTSPVDAKPVDIPSPSSSVQTYVDDTPLIMPKVEVPCDGDLLRSLPAPVQPPLPSLSQPATPPPPPPITIVAPQAVAPIAFPVFVRESYSNIDPPAVPITRPQRPTIMLPEALPVQMHAPIPHQAWKPEYEYKVVQACQIHPHQATPASPSYSYPFSAPSPTWTTSSTDYDHVVCQPQVAMSEYPTPVHQSSFPPTPVDAPMPTYYSVQVDGYQTVAQPNFIYYGQPAPDMHSYCEMPHLQMYQQ